MSVRPCLRYHDHAAHEWAFLEGDHRFWRNHYCPGRPYDEAQPALLEVAQD